MNQTTRHNRHDMAHPMLKNIIASLKIIQEIAITAYEPFTHQQHALNETSYLNELKSLIESSHLDVKTLAISDGRKLLIELGVTCAGTLVTIRPRLTEQTISLTLDINLQNN